MNPIHQLKQELKTLSFDIRQSRRSFKDTQREIQITSARDDLDRLFRQLWSFGVKGRSAEFRTKHIAYCLLRGRTYEQIEPKVLKGNGPDWDKINAIVDWGKRGLEAILRSA